jgi:dTDP-4-dehydrorhamnose 3,5-epimerase
VIFTPTPLAGAFVVEPEPSSDDRGLFARTWCRREFEARGLETRIGMHYQVAPFAETKLVRCVRGSMFDVIIDLRLDAPTFTKHVAVVLSADNRKAMYVPTGFAHGFQTLEDGTEVFYQISEFYSPEHERTISERDRSYPDVLPYP